MCGKRKHSRYKSPTEQRHAREPAIELPAVTGRVATQTTTGVTVLRPTPTAPLVSYGDDVEEPPSYSDAMGGLA